MMKIEELEKTLTELNPNWVDAVRMCRENNCDMLLSLDAFGLNESKLLYLCLEYAKLMDVTVQFVGRSRRRMTNLN